MQTTITVHINNASKAKRTFEYHNLDNVLVAPIHVEVVNYVHSQLTNLKSVQSIVINVLSVRDDCNALEYVLSYFVRIEKEESNDIQALIDLAQSKARFWHFATIQRINNRKSKPVSTIQYDAPIIIEEPVTIDFTRFTIAELDHFATVLEDQNIFDLCAEHEYMSICKVLQSKRDAYYASVDANTDKTNYLVLIPDWHNPQRQPMPDQIDLKVTVIGNETVVIVSHVVQSSTCHAMRLGNIDQGYIVTNPNIAVQEYANHNVNFWQHIKMLVYLIYTDTLISVGTSYNYRHYKVTL